MKRNLTAMTEREFDLLVIGAGAFGAAAAWDASLRGLRVALIDQCDFGSGASAECFKVVHGGIRYLQHGNIKRLRSSCRERSAWLRIAPHLVKPLPIVVPTFGAGRRGKAFLGAGMYAYDLLTAGRNHAIDDPSRRIPGTRFLSRGELLDVFPELDQPSLTGGAIFNDGQMYNPARLVLAFVRSAVDRGTVAANYVQATDFLYQGRRVCGVKARDVLNGSDFDIRARLVLNAAGPWAEYLLGDPAHFGQHHRGHFSRDAFFIVKRRPRSAYALAVPGQSRDRDTLISRAARHLFAVPWREHTLIGVWHRPFAERPDAAAVDDYEIASWITEMNASHPALQLRQEEVSYACCGLVPFGDGSSNVKELSFGKESRLVDHQRTHNIAGLVTLIGIRFTMARADAAMALDLLLQQWSGKKLRPVATEHTPLLGGDIADFPALLAQTLHSRPASISAQSLAALVYTHGTEVSALLARAQLPGESTPIGNSDTLLAEVTHAVETEMAVRLEDVVLRRTDLGSASHPGREAIEQAASGMQPLLHWSERQRTEEIAATEQVLRRHHAIVPESRISDRMVEEFVR
jgi:glycerol-3-phosphate dehydrogenase